ncbi:hypothetical protein R4Z09_13380 [Niallia oryzisoli]|uniref:Uncharacterized protein n=1 Tax=Niallia oryzisoli TaxID=1737571 RepID=A0ABZ2CS03_9BACI
MLVISDKDIKGEDYRSLIELASKKCDRQIPTVSVTVRMASF